MSSDEYPVLRCGKLQSDGSLRVKRVLGSPHFVLGSQRPGIKVDSLKLTLTPTPLGDPGCTLDRSDVLAECRAAPKDPSMVERTNILRGFEVLESKLLSDESYARLAEVRQIIPLLTPSAIETRSE